MDNDERLKVVRQRRLQREFGMLGKQIRMLIELTKHSPAITGETTSVLAGALLPEAEYLVIERQQINVLLEGADSQVFSIKSLLDALYKWNELL